jgi:TRIAD3 protein (E3 ubiquitin-protein ligase RNF216)
MKISSFRKLPLLQNSIDENFSKELKYIDELKIKEIETKDKKIAEELNDKLCEESGATIECGCCCSDFAFEKLVQCTEGFLIFLIFLLIFF